MSNMKFEEAMKKLEKIAEELEIGDITLDDSFEKFKEGMDLSVYCNKKLDEIEKKITVLIEENGGTYNERPFENSRGEGHEY